MQAERLRRCLEHPRRVLALREAPEEVLLQERVRPAVAARPPRQHDLGLLELGDRVLGGELQVGEQRDHDFAPDVHAEGRDGVGRDAQVTWDGGDAAVPEIGRGLRPHREHVARHAITRIDELQVSRVSPGMQLLQREEWEPAATTGRLVGRVVVERQRRADERARRVLVHRTDLDDLAVHRLAQLTEALGGRRAELHVLGPDGGDHEDGLIELLAVDLQQAVEGRLGGVVKVVEEEEEGASVRDPPDRVLADEAPELQRVQREADAARTDALVTRGERAHPLRGASHPRLPLPIVLVDLPAVHQGALDGVAIRALEVEVLDDCAEHAVEGAPHRAIPRRERHHAAVLVGGLAQPFRDARLADAGGPEQHHQAVGRPLAHDHLPADRPEASADVVATDHGARTNAEEPRSSIRNRLDAAARSRAGGARRRRRRRAVGLHDGRELEELRVDAVRNEFQPRSPGLGRELEAIPGPLRQETHDELVDAGGRRAVELGWRGLMIRVELQELLRIAGEGRAPAHHLVEDASEGVEVRRAHDVVHFVLDLLRGHVARRPGARVGRELHGLLAVQALVVQILAEPGEPEVQDVNARHLIDALLDDDVGRLQVSVDDAPGVGMSERAEHPVHDGPDDREAQLRLGEVVERDARDQVHGQERRTVCQLAEVARVHDPGMVERGERS